MILQKTLIRLKLIELKPATPSDKKTKLTVDQAMTAGGETLFGEWSDTSQGCAP